MANFIYYNQNPNGTKENDCVTRAISLACNIDYSDVRRKLYHISRLLECEKLCVCCYKHLLEDIFKLNSINCKGITINQFSNENPIGVFILRINGHLTCLIDNTIYDIWDCRNEILTNAWEVA